VCNILYGDRIVKKNVETGEYDVYGGGDKTFTTKDFNREGYNIVIGRFALSKKCVRILNKKFYLNDSGLTILSKSNNILDKYIGYYLLYNQNNIYSLARGGGQKNLDMEKFKLLKIPIPSVSTQNKIIVFLENLYKSYDDIQNTINYYETQDIFKLLLLENFTQYNYLLIQVY